MFEIGFPELILIAIVGLLVIGPERLPEALRTLGLWIGRMRRSFTNVKTEIEKEIGMDEIRRQLHNEAVMEEMKRIERDVRDSVNAKPGHRDRPRNSAADAADTSPDHVPEPHPSDGQLPDTANRPAPTEPPVARADTPPEGDTPEPSADPDKARHG